MFHRLLKRRQVQPITDLHTALEPLLKSCHASGILPIEQRLNTCTYESSKLWLMYSSVTLVTYLVVSYFAFRSNNTFAKNRDEQSNITNLGYKISAFAIVGLCTVCLTVTVIQRLKIARFFNTVHVVTTSLMKTGVKFTYDRTYLLFHCQIVIGILLCVIVSFAAAIYARVLVTNCLVRLMSSLVVYIFACLFANCLLLMYQRFDIINKRITQICCDQVISNENVLDEIRVLARCHDILCDGADYVNNAFMFQLLYFVLVVFVTGLLTTFNNIKAVYRTTPMDDDELTELLRQSIWTIHNSAILTTMMVACTATCNQANSTGKHIHKLLISVTDNKINQMLKTFSLQVMHRRLEFHACGMFTFDYTLLFSLVAAATTYLVILIQFDQAKIEQAFAQVPPENVSFPYGFDTE